MYSDTPIGTRFKLHRNGVYYDTPIVRARVTTVLSLATATVQGYMHHAATGTTGATLLGALLHDDTTHQDTAQAIPLAVDSWESIRFTGQPDAAESYFPGNGGGPGVWEDYFYYTLTEDAPTTGVIVFDVILMSTGFAGYSISGTGE